MRLDHLLSKEQPGSEDSDSQVDRFFGSNAYQLFGFQGLVPEMIFENCIEEEKRRVQ